MDRLKSNLLNVYIINKFFVFKKHSQKDSFPYYMSHADFKWDLIYI